MGEGWHCDRRVFLFVYGKVVGLFSFADGSFVDFLLGRDCICHFLVCLSSDRGDLRLVLCRGGGGAGFAESGRFWGSRQLGLWDLVCKGEVYDGPVDGVSSTEYLVIFVGVTRPFRCGALVI